MREEEKIAAGILFSPADPELKKIKLRTHKLNIDYNSTYEDETERRNSIISQIVGEMGPNGFIQGPIQFHYGIHTHIGKNFFANYNCTLLDVAQIKIGDNCQLAPNVAIYTAGHPVHPVSRNSAYEYGKEVTIGDNVWIGGNTVVCPGVHIGSNVVIGAGSVVTKNIPDWCIAAGNPCKVIRKITDDDKKKLYRDEEIDEEAWNDIVARME